jgi:hypothetical protein
MKSAPFRFFAAFVALLCFAIVSPCRATLVTFDDLSETGSGSFLANGYQGLNWSYWGVNNAILFTNVLPHLFAGAPSNGLSGNYYGMVSASNVTFNASGLPVDIDSPSNFNFQSAYLTGEWNSNLNIEVQGFNGSTMLYDTTVVVSATSPTLFTFDYLNINDLHFDASGGEPAFGTASGAAFVMDNFDFDFVPEPSSFLLTAAGALMLCAVVKRKRE